METSGRLITDYYADQNRQLHQRQNWGESGRKYAKYVMEFSRALEARSILDYGCGRGTLKIELEKRSFATPVSEYDPAIPGKEFMPIAADLVVCTDVMEHVEPQFIANVLTHIYRLSRLGAYIVIATRPTDHILPDGRQAHLTVEGPEYWQGKIDANPWREQKQKIHYNEQTGKIKKVTFWLKK